MAVPARPSRLVDKEYARTYWVQLDDLFYRTIAHAERAFKINLNINIVLVIVGIVILAYSIIYSWHNSLDLYTTAFGTLGILDFVAIFYLSPQRNIQKTVGDLTQIQMFYRSYYIQIEYIIDWANLHQDMTIEELEKWNKRIEEVTINITEKIEELIGKKENE
jgi:hypothetical protein